MRLRLLFCLVLIALASPVLADSIPLKITNLTITSPGGQTATGGVMAGDQVANSGPLMLKAPNSALVAELGGSAFDTTWMFIAPNTSLASLNGYQVSFGVESAGKVLGTITATLSVRSDGVAVATILNPNLVFQGLDQFLQLSFSIAPNPVGLGTGNYDFQARLSAVPEPQSLVLLGFGLLFGAYYLRQRRQTV